MSDSGPIRASDADRERVAADIRDHFAAGRLTEEELSERLDAVYRARALSELDALGVDLPRLPAPPADARAEVGQRRAMLQRQLVQQVGGALSPFAVCVIIWAASGAHEQFWPVWVLIFPAMLLLRNGWALFGPAPDLDRVEADLDRHRRHVARRAGRHARRRGRRELGP